MRPLLFCRALSMSRNEPTASQGPRRLGHWAPHLRQFSRTSLDRLPALESPQSPDTVSSNSTLRDRPPSRVSRMERKCTVTVNETFAREEVQMNLDLFDPDVKPGALMAIEVLRPDTDRSPLNPLHKQGVLDRGQDASPSRPTPQGVDVGRRYLFIVKDMSKDLKARHPNVELYVAKHIADVFGMKRGSQVLLTQVRLLSSSFLHCSCSYSSHR